MNQVVTFTDLAHDGKKGTSKRGPYHFRVFKTAGGAKFQTLDVAIGDQVVASYGTAVDVEYEIDESGDYKNNVLKSIRPLATNGDFAVDHVAVQQAVNNANGSKSDYETERQLRIMRQSALQRAIDTAATHGKIEDPQELFKLADTYLLYFEAGSSAFTPSTPQAEESLKF